MNNFFGFHDSSNLFLQQLYAGQILPQHSNQLYHFQGFYPTYNATSFNLYEQQMAAQGRPLVNPRHPAYRPCKKFLEYLQKTWFRGTFKDMWCKGDMHELRTTNSAEAFHSKLRRLLSSRIHPPFEDLLEMLQEINMAALGTLLHMDVNHDMVRHLRRRDSRRRRKISQTMDEFKQEMNRRRHLPVAVINLYCR